MNLRLLSLEGPQEARPHLELFERAAAETVRSWRDEPLPPGAVARYLERSGGAPETLVVVAEEVERGEVLGAAASGPFLDPLTGEATPMLVFLWVAPEIRHRGVARALLEELQRRLAQRGLRGLLARAGHNDDAVISMGERLGWVRSVEILGIDSP